MAYLILRLDSLKENSFNLGFKINERHLFSLKISIFKTKYLDTKLVHQITTKSETTISLRTETKLSGTLSRGYSDMDNLTF